MPELQILQQSFCDAIFDVKRHNLDFISSSSADERFAIYRNSIIENMVTSLKVTYPAIWQLLGQECANNSVLAFINIKDNLPKTGDLEEFGEGFAKFLGTLPELKSLPYLQDYASYEWLKNKAYIAEDAMHIDSLDLQNITEDEIENVKFIFVPSFVRFKSQFPLHEIQELLENTALQAIKLSKVGAYGIIARRQNQIFTYWVTRELWYFIDRLAKGYNLSEASYYAQNINEQFNLTEALAFMLKQQIISKLV